DCLEEVLGNSSDARRGGGSVDEGRGRLRRPPLSDMTGWPGRRKDAGDASVPSPTMTTVERDGGRPQGSPPHVHSTPAPTMTMTERDGGRPQGSPPHVYPTPAPTMTTEVALLHNMLTIPSFSGREGVLAGFLVEEARRMGLRACVDDAGNFVACTGSLDEVDMDAQPVVLLGHMDTVRGNIPVRLQDG